MANEIRVEKCFYDLNEYMDYSGFLTQAEVPYLVFGVEEELAALNAVREASPENLENLTRRTLEISERICRNRCYSCESSVWSRWRYTVLH